MGLPTVYLVWLVEAVASHLGDAALYFGLGWAATAQGRVAAGLVLSASSLPRALLLLVGGAAGDRCDARRIMIAGDAVMLVVACSLAITAGAIGLGQGIHVAGRRVVDNSHSRRRSPFVFVGFDKYTSRIILPKLHAMYTYSWRATLPAEGGLACRPSRSANRPTHAVAGPASNCWRPRGRSWRPTASRP